MEENQIQDKPKISVMLPGSIIVAALIIGGAVIYSTGLKATGSDSLARLGGGTSTITDETRGNVSEDDDVILGSVDAPVTMILFGDYQCPFCGQMYREVEGKLRDEYVQTGLVRMVYRDFPLDSIHPYARDAAEAAQCAKDQGSYWAYHDVLFERQSEIPTLDFVAVAGELGLDRDSFRACISAGTYKDEIEKDLQDGIAAGVRGTPGTYINGRAVHGAQPYAAFKQVIDEELEKANK